MRLPPSMLSISIVLTCVACSIDNFGEPNVDEDFSSLSTSLSANTGAGATAIDETLLASVPPPRGSTNAREVDAVNGNDDNSGQQGSPWKNIEYAVSQLQAGQALYVLSNGAHNPTATISTPRPGTSSNPIWVIGVSGGSKPVINGNFAGTLFQIQHSYWVFRNLDMNKSKRQGDVIRITAASAISNIAIVDNTIRGAEACTSDTPNNKAHGVVIHNSAGASNSSIKTSQVFVVDNQIYDLVLKGGSGCSLYDDAIGVYILSGSKDVVVRGNSIYDFGGDGVHCSGADVNQNYILTETDPDNILLEDNQIYSTSSFFGKAENAVDIKDCQNITIRGSVPPLSSNSGVATMNHYYTFRPRSSSQGTSTSNGAAVVVHYSTKSVLIENTRISNSCRALALGNNASNLLIENLVVRRNLFTMGTVSGCSVNDAIVVQKAKSVDFHNNTFMNIPTEGIRLIGGSGLSIPDVDIWNNIFYDVGTWIRVDNTSQFADLESNNNIFFNPDDATPENFRWGSSSLNLSGWKTPSNVGNLTLDSNSTSADPLFVANSADYHLQSMSPARDSGLNIDASDLPKCGTHFDKGWIEMNEACSGSQLVSLPFTDNFDNCANSSMLEDRYGWSVSGNWYCQSARTRGDTSGGTALVDTVDLLDVEVQALVQLNLGNNSAGVVARHTSGDFYAVRILDDTDEVEIVRMNSGTPTRLDAVSYSVSQNSSVVLQLVATGSSSVSLEATVNPGQNEVKLTATDSSSSRLGAGRVGLLTGGNRTQFDNFSVAAAAPPSSGLPAVDDFSDCLDDDNLDGRGFWLAGGTWYCRDQRARGETGDTVAVFDIPESSDIEVEALVQLNLGASGSGVVLRHSGSSYYAARLRYDTQQIELLRNSGGAVTQLNALPFAVAQNSSVTIRLKAFGDSPVLLTAVINPGPNEVYITAIDSATGKLSTGKAGLLSGDGGRTQFDNFHVDVLQSSSVPSGKVLVADDFNGCADDSPPDSTVWVVNATDLSKVYCRAQRIRMEEADAGIYGIHSALADGEVQSLVQLNGVGGNATKSGVVFRRVGDDFYVARLRFDTNPTRIEVVRVNGGSEITLGTYDTAISLNTSYVVKLVVTGSASVSIEVSLGGSLVLSLSDTSSARLRAGYAGILSGTSARTQYDNVVVTSR